MFRRLSVDYTLGKIFSEDMSAKDLGFIHGLRVGSLIWIIVSHSYAYLELNSMCKSRIIFESRQSV